MVLRKDYIYQEIARRYKSRPLRAIRKISDFTIVNAAERDPLYQVKDVFLQIDDISETT